MGSGRPQQFHRDAVLDRATQVFWERGYEAASVQDLLDRMDLHRGSLYNAFGDKPSLFLECLERYCAERREAATSLLRGVGSPLGGLEALVASWQDQALAEPRRGCLATNAAVELAGRVPAVADTLTYHFNRLERMIRTTLEHAVDGGELDHAADTRAIARWLVNAMQGLMVMARANASEETIADIAVGMRALLHSS